MVEKRASLILELKDFATSKLGDFKTAILGITAAVASMIAIMAKLMAEWGKQEDAVMKLNLAISKNIDFIGKNSDKLVELADSLQKVTRFADEDIISMEALLATFKFTESEIIDLIPRVLDLSAATGIDLRSATLALAKAIETGSGASLLRMGILIDDNILKSGDFSDIIGELDNKFGGLSKELGGNTLGTMIRFKNVIGEIMEKIGEFISDPAKKYLNWFIKLEQAVEEAIKSQKTINKETENTGSTKKDLLKLLDKEEKLTREQIKANKEALKSILELISLSLSATAMKLDMATKAEKRIKEGEERLIAIEKARAKTVKEAATEINNAYDDEIAKNEELRLEMEKISPVLTEQQEINKRKTEASIINSMNERDAWKNYWDSMKLWATETESTWKTFSDAVRDDFIALISDLLNGFDNLWKFMTGGFKKDEWKAFLTEVESGFKGFLSNIMSAINDLIAEMIAKKIIAWALSFLKLGGGEGAPKMGRATALKEYQKGTNYVPETGLALLHEGEAVIPADKNAPRKSFLDDIWDDIVDPITDFFGGGGGMGGFLKKFDKFKDFFKDVGDYIGAGTELFAEYVRLWIQYNGRFPSLGELANNILEREHVADRTQSFVDSGLQGAMKDSMKNTVLGAASMPGFMNRMANGGIVTGSKNGTQIIAGENYQSEAIVPLNKLNGITININAGTIIADNMSVREFARKIDNELYRLSRNKQTNSIL